jgi:hypothetical protein
VPVSKFVVGGAVNLPILLVKQMGHLNLSTKFWLNLTLQQYQ